MPGEVVIIATDGSEHVFPPGFDPKQAAAIVRRQSQSPAEQTGMLDGLLSAVGDAGKGALSGFASTVHHGGDLIRRGLGMARTIDLPENKAAMTPPNSLAGKAGFVAEQLGEFLIPASKAAKATEGANLLRRAATQGAVGGGVSAAQSGGNPTDTAVGAVSGAAGPVVEQGVKQGARAVYRGYLKPSLAAKNSPKAKQIVETALAEAIPITRSGASYDPNGSGQIVGKAGKLMTELRAEVDAEIRAAKGTIDLKRIADRVRRMAKAKYDRPAADPADLKAALDVADRIDGHASIKGATAVSIPKANEAKRTLQDTARNSFGTPNAPAKKIAEKAGARKLRVAIEANTGGRTGTVAQLNARESKLISAAKAVAAAVEREGNQQALYGMKTLAAIGAGGGMGYREGGTPGAVAGAAATRMALRPGSASWAAIIANRIAKELGVSAATAGRLAQVVLSDRAHGK
jgi:hypothetical protein